MSPAVLLDLGPFPGESGFLRNSGTDNGHGEAIVAVASSMFFQARIGVFRYTVHHNIPAVPQNVPVCVSFSSILDHRLPFPCLLCNLPYSYFIRLAGAQ
jgi:hypothetical protein